MSRAATPPCAASMGCLCAGHARGNPATAPCDTSEVPSAPEMTEALDEIIGLAGYAARAKTATATSALNRARARFLARFL